MTAKPDWGSVSTLFKGIRETPLQRAEKGAAYVALAEVYLDTMNSVSEKYRKSLEETIRDWSKLDNLGKSFEEKLSLAKIRATLKK